MPDYTVSYVGHFEDNKIYKVQHGSELYEFLIEPSHLLSDGFHMVQHSSDNNTSSLHTIDELTGCTYTGQAISHNDTFISLAGCDARKVAISTLSARLVS